MYSRKRKTSYLELNCYRQEDEDEEDEWEREASSSAYRNKPLPPNPYAIQVDILNNQHAVLNETIQNLTEQLEQLERELEQLEHQESTQGAELQQEYIKSIEETASLIHTIASSEQEFQYLELETKDIAKDWKQVLDARKQDKTQLESWAHAYRSAEFDVIDLTSQINGYEARIQVLDRERAKLNSLPQIIPILTAETEKVSLDMKNTTAQLEALEKDTLRPQLKKLADMSVITPFQLGQLKKDLDLMRDIEKALDKSRHILIKQRACQQMMAYINDTSLACTKNKLEAIRSVVEAMENQQYSAKVDEPLESSNVGDSQLHITTIKDLLDEFFESKHMDVKERTLLEQLDILKDYEAQLKSKWQDDFQSCLDAAQELGALQHRLQATLYTHSSSSENLVLTPKPYTSLQSELEFRTLEIKAALSELEKNLNDADNKLLFEQQKKLFALFFTDPISFEQLHSNLVNK